MSVLPKISWPVPSSNRGTDFASQEDVMSHLEGEATGWYMVGSNGMWHGGIHITSTTTPWCALSGETTSELLDFPVPFKGEQSVRCMADGEVVAYRICRDYLNVPWETGPLSFSGSFVLVRHFIQPGEKKENGLHFYTLYMHLAPYSAYEKSEHETHWIVNDKLPVFRPEWTPDASAENRNKYRIASIPKGSRIEWDATETSCSATGPKVRRYGLVTFRGLSDEAKSRGTNSSLVEGQKYWILTDRDNLVPASGAAARPSWWSHLLPPYAEPMQFDRVVCPTPYPMSAGDSIGHLGYFQIPKDGDYDSRYQVHIECLSADDRLPTFLTNPEKVGESTPLYLKCPPGLPLFSKDLHTNTMVSAGKVTQGEAILKLGQVKTELDAQKQEYWFLPYANGYVPKSNKSAETLSQYDLEKLGFITTVDEAPSFDHLDGTTSPTGLVPGILNRLLDASSADTRLTHRAVPHNYQRLLNRIDSRVSPYSSQEYLSAIHNPSYRDVKNKMVVKHPSEWYHKKETFIWQSFLNKLTSDAPEWREYCEDYLDKMVWMQDASKLKLGSSLWHMHPVAFLGAIKGIPEHEITVELIEKLLGHTNPWFTGKRGGKAFATHFKNTYPDVYQFDKQTFVDLLNEQLAEYGISSPYHKAHFLSQCLHESAHLDTTIEFGSGRNYDPGQHNDAVKNGNTVVGDGPRYKGRGLIQLTWKKNYQHFSTYSGVDCVNNSELVASVMINAIKASCWFWRNNGGIHKKYDAKGDINILIDNEKNNVELITLAVNGGLNGLSERQGYYNSIKKEWDLK
ncbi:glycoside hydrolase family 19 protein [Pantoea dispersa]|uniref:glycoside hydrolase family 19 protein n=1 Tax=Pantoea dispersa TaxID=59814 RepID=UPI00163AB42D|nr:glycoside hydrolase family 19 protein [Pantoea dispersa]